MFMTFMMFRNWTEWTAWTKRTCVDQVGPGQGPTENEKNPLRSSRSSLAVLFHELRR
jgi:hypothetical protein